MAYNIKLTNGEPLTTISNGSVDNDHTSLNLVGKNFTGYGQMMNENFVHLLENFSNATAPANPLVGQIWYDTTARIIKVRTADSTWKTIGSATASGISPQNPVVGDLWWDTIKTQLKGWNGTTWIIVGPAPGPTGYTGSQGIQGLQGFTGATGPKGDNGERGPQGEQGMTGLPGPDGAVGYTGSKGDPGRSFSGIVEDDITINTVNIGRGPNSKSHNTRVGVVALDFNTLGNYNTAVGFAALNKNTIGNFNTAYGALAGYSNVGGEYNTTIGVNAGYSNTDGDSNTAVGFAALQTNATGNQNVAVGSAALYLNTAGNYNTALGTRSLINNTSGSYNTSIGHGALSANQTGIRNVAVGNGALLNTTSNENTAVGYWSLINNTTGSLNIGVGVGTLGNNTTGTRNVAIGDRAGNAITTGSKNVIVGGNTGSTIATSNNNVIISDGDGNIRAQCAGDGAWQFNGIVRATTPPAAANDTQVATTAFVQTKLLQQIYPIGTIYTSVVSTNPATLLGFGTWVSFGASQFLMGAGGGAVGGQQGGTADAVVVEHTHTATSTVSDPGHAHSYLKAVNAYPQSGSSTACFTGYAWDTTSKVQTGVGVATTVNFTGENGVGKNLPPYIVVYMWQRTA